MKVFQRVAQYSWFYILFSALGESVSDHLHDLKNYWQNFRHYRHINPGVARFYLKSTFEVALTLLSLPLIIAFIILIVAVCLPFRLIEQLKNLYCP